MVKIRKIVEAVLSSSITIVYQVTWMRYFLVNQKSKILAKPGWNNTPENLSFSVRIKNTSDTLPDIMRHQ